MEKFIRCALRFPIIRNLTSPPKNVPVTSKLSQLSVRYFSGTSQSLHTGSTINVLLLRYSLVGLSGLGVGLWLGHREKLHSYKNKWMSAFAASPFTDIPEEASAGKTDLKTPYNFNFIADVVEKTASAVVYIEIHDLRRRDMMTGKHLTISNGSGFFVSSDGRVLTNAHVVENRPKMSSISVKLSDGRSFKAMIEEVDRASDLATLRIPAKDVPTLSLGDSSKLRPGEWVVAMGSPLSLANTITVGVVSSKGRGGSELGLRSKDIEYIQTDAAITFGNSGGPLVNLDGEAIGINSMKVTSGISFAIPSDYAKEFLKVVESRKKSSWFSQVEGKDERHKKIYLGITMLTLNPRLILELQQRMHNIPPNITEGVLVWRLVVGSPAFKAGVQPGDILIEINGKPIKSANDVYRAVESEQSLNIVIIRDSKKFTATVVPEE